MSGPLIDQVGRVARRDMVPPVGRPTRFRALLIVGGLLALMKVVFYPASTPKWLGGPNSRTHAKTHESHMQAEWDEATISKKRRSTG